MNYVVERQTPMGRQWLSDHGIWRHDPKDAALMDKTDAIYLAFRSSTRSKPAKAVRVETTTTAA